MGQRGHRPEPDMIGEYVEAQIEAGSVRRTGDELILACPFCGKEDHFYVSVDKGLYHCFKCKDGGKIHRWIGQNVERWRVKTGSVKVPQGTDLWCGLDKLHRNRPWIGHPVVALQRHSVDWLSPYAEPKWSSAAYAYLQSRGVTVRQMRRYRAFVRPYEGRVFFPVWDEYERIVYYVARSLDDQIKPKTLEPAGRDKPLFGMHCYEKDKRLTGPGVVLVEGVFDHLATKSSLAILGSSVTNHQAMLLMKHQVRSVFLVLDPDLSTETMVKEAKRLADRSGLGVWPVKLETTRDPADLGRDIMSNLFTELFRLQQSRPHPRLLHARI